MDEHQRGTYIMRAPSEGGFPAGWEGTVTCHCKWIYGPATGNTEWAVFSALSAVWEDHSLALH